MVGIKHPSRARKVLYSISESLIEWLIFLTAAKTATVELMGRNLPTTTTISHGLIWDEDYAPAKHYSFPSPLWDRSKNWKNKSE